MFSDIMSHENEEEKEFDKNEINRNSKDVSQPLMMSLHSNQDDKEREEINEDKGELIKKTEDVVYILYLSKDGLDDVSDTDNE